MSTHAAVAASRLGGALVEAALADWRTAPVSEPVHAALGFLEKLTLHPEAVTVEDADILRAAGVSDAAIEETVYVVFLMSVIGRLADAFDFDLPSAGDNRWNTLIANVVGYRGLTWLG